jgi:hypothetical protein
MLAWSIGRVELIDITVGNAARLGASQRSTTRRCASQHIATQRLSRWGSPAALARLAPTGCHRDRRKAFPCVVPVAARMDDDCRDGGAVSAASTLRLLSKRTGLLGIGDSWGAGVGGSTAAAVNAIGLTYVAGDASARRRV